MADAYDVHNARFAAPTADDMDASLRKSFGVADPAPEHDPSDPALVSAALMVPFPAEAIFRDDKGMNYVKYQQVVRRLIRATGNRFDVEVIDQRITPHGQTNRGVDKYLILATVKLTIPVLQSSRTQIGVQVAMANTEDLFKGAVSDGIKKCAQAFGVAIELAGDDRELAATHALNAPEPSGSNERPSRLSHIQNGGNAPQRPVQRVTDGEYMAGQGDTERKRTDQQGKALWKISNGNRDLIAEWCQPYGVTNDRDLTEAQAGEIISQYGGGR